MIRLIAFDLDGTLAQLGKGILPEDFALLRRLEDSGVRIAICSGKTTYYLCGLMRQVGLRAPVLIGENGAAIQFGIDLPPKEYHIAPYSSGAKRSLRLLKDTLQTVVPDIWYQPNEVALTPFPKNEAGFDAIKACLDALDPLLEDLTIYRHCDCFDIMPNGITKKSGLERLGKLLGISPEETVCVGDGVNDYPMFEYAGLSVGINVKEPERVKMNFDSANKALTFLLSMLETE